jgi:ribonuclease P protein component
MYTFKKEERLCSKKLLEELFRNGSSFFLYPFRISSLPATLDTAVPVQVVISVSKRRFKRASDRNLIKRRIRESYRIIKAEQLYPFLREQNLQVLLSISYVGNEILAYPEIDTKLKEAIERLKVSYAGGVLE